MADALCTFGGGHKVGRIRGHIGEGVDELLVEVFANGTFSGIQVGYSIDGGATQWLDPVPPPGGTDRITVSPSDYELDRRQERWEFYVQLNLPDAAQDCYTGLGNGDYHIVIRSESE